MVFSSIVMLEENNDNDDDDVALLALSSMFLVDDVSTAQEEAVVGDDDGGSFSSITDSSTFFFSSSLSFVCSLHFAFFVTFDSVVFSESDCINFRRLLFLLLCSVCCSCCDEEEDEKNAGLNDEWTGMLIIISCARARYSSSFSRSLFTMDMYDLSKTLTCPKFLRISFGRVDILSTNDSKNVSSLLDIIECV